MTIDDVVRSLPYCGPHQELPAPRFDRENNKLATTKLALAVASMKDHMTDEGWQIMAGLRDAGYVLCGKGLSMDETDVSRLLDRFPTPAVLLMQDKREWDKSWADFRDPLAAFTNYTTLAERGDVFKLTILKDAHQRPFYHSMSAEEIGCHAWVVYYAIPIVKKVAPYIRTRHAIRTYHTVDASRVPIYSADGRAGCLLSGAVSNVYPLRQRLFRESSLLPETTVLRHPGYHRNGSATPEFLKTLSRYKVAICTASQFGYSLRKIIEATACGCVVITDLPTDDVLPEIDGNLIRVPSTSSTADIAAVVSHALSKYDPSLQSHYAAAAMRRYDYRFECLRLSKEIDALRRRYKG